jgi:hypothetical protein
VTRDNSHHVASLRFPSSRITDHASRIASRVIEPELLDHLPESDPSAVQSRRDLQRVNWWMGNARKVASAICASSVQAGPRTFVELGAGDGTFFLRVAWFLGPAWKGSQVLLLDRQEIVSSATRVAFSQIGWQVQTLRAEVFEALLSLEPCDIMMANLFLHHFPDARLRELFELACKRASLFVAVEPRRSAQAILFSRLLWIIGCNHVTRHDAVVSVRAGFHASEMSTLWPQDPGWHCIEHRAGLCSHLFVARPGSARVPPA